MKKALVVFVSIIVLVALWLGYLSYDADQRDVEASKVPLVTVMEILHASDLQKGVKAAVKIDDAEAIDTWLTQALQVGNAANLAKEDLDYLASDAARDYVVFNAKRQLYNDAFEARYYSLKEVESLKAQYPEAKDLFPRTDALIEKRDAIIKQIAIALSNEDSPSEDALEEARQQWLMQAQKPEA